MTNQQREENFDEVAERLEVIMDSLSDTLFEIVEKIRETNKELSEISKAIGNSKQ